MKKTSSGQMAVEFILVLPWLCALLVAFIIFILFCVRSQGAIYAGFMASRIFGIWPDKIGEIGRNDVVDVELNSLLKGQRFEYEFNNDVLSVRARGESPFVLGLALDAQEFETQSPVVFEPFYACKNEDNPLPTATPEVCP